MNRRELRNWDLMQNCARVLLVHGYRRSIEPGTENQSTVDDCVRISFSGDWKAFEKWAMEYAEQGCGVSG